MENVIQDPRMAGVKEAARLYDVSPYYILVVALAQLNRAAAHAVPSVADLRESGQVEQDADSVLLLSNDDSQYLAILAKNKEGKTGKIPITFDKEHQRFLEITGGVS